jgi:G6PDH family F420-dependent oxidoreductase
MLELGYALSSEEFGPADLIANARTAESVGFQFALISDHFHPWTNQQPHSPFVWSVIGGISQAVKTLSLGTGVTCPLMRYNPAITAQAAATSAVMMPARFFLGLGTGENLNEHITGMHWPPASQRQEMLEEAVAVMRLLWHGGWQTHRGKYYTVEQARIFTMPDEPPPIVIAASKPGSAELAGKIGDGHQHRAETRSGQALRTSWRQGQAALRTDNRLLRVERRRSRAHRAQAMAQRRHRRATDDGSAAAKTL